MIQKPIIKRYVTKVVPGCKSKVIYASKFNLLQTISTISFSASLLFKLLTNLPTNPDPYRFDSVAVKEPKFEIDGVFLPLETEGAGVVYFYEV